MNRTDRLYALVEDLRAVAPRRRTARELAARHEVSIRTVERDIAALQQAGVPILAEAGRTGGYTLDRRMSLPPLNFSPAEAVAIGVALRSVRGTPFEAAGAAALGRIMAAMSDESAGAARDLAARVRMIAPSATPPAAVHAGVVQQAVLRRRVIEMSYIDRFGALTERAVEPLLLMCGAEWYLVGWCRLRAQNRLFRLDRIAAAELAEPVVASRPVCEIDDLPPDRLVQPVNLESP